MAKFRKEEIDPFQFMSFLFVFFKSIGNTLKDAEFKFDLQLCTRNYTQKDIIHNHTKML